MAALDGFRLVKFLVFRSSRQIVARRHRESVGQQIGAAEDQDDAERQVRAHDSSDNGEHRYGAVNAAIDPIFYQSGR